MKLQKPQLYWRAEFDCEEVAECSFTIKVKEVVKLLQESRKNDSIKEASWQDTLGHLTQPHC